MKIVDTPLGEIRPYGKNAKKHDAKQVANVAESIRQYGFVQPIVVDGDGVIVIGHCRYAAAKKLGMATVPCVCVDELTQEQVDALRIVDNKTNESPWDFDLLSADILSLDLSAFDFDFGIPSMKECADDESVEPEDQTEDIPQAVEDEPPEVDETAEPIAKLGDIWQLGRHKLMCGSSTDFDDVVKLMDGNKAKMLFTSPPYSDMREYEGGKDLNVSNISKFIAAYRDFTDYQCVNLGIQRKNNEIYPYWDEYIDIAKNSGYKLMAWNVWDKLMCGSIGQQKAFFPIRHEWIFVFGTKFFEINQTWKKKEENIRESHNRNVRQADGSMKESSTGDSTNKYKQMESVLPLYAEMGKIRSLHPATFPVALPSEYIKAMSDQNDIIIEPFCGSGTTLVACEQLNRKCFGMELEPKYCDVIIKRWETLTGEKAIKI